MSEADLALARIEAIVTEIEHLDATTGGDFRQSSDLEAGALVSRIIRCCQQQSGGLKRLMPTPSDPGV